MGPSLAYTHESFFGVRHRRYSALQACRSSERARWDPPCRLGYPTQARAIHSRSKLLRRVCGTAGGRSLRGGALTRSKRTARDPKPNPSIHHAAPPNIAFVGGAAGSDSDSDSDSDCVQQCLDTDRRRSLLVHEDDADTCGCECDDSDDSDIDGSDARVEVFYGLLLGDSDSNSDSSSDINSDSDSAYCRGFCHDYCSLTPGAFSRGNINHPPSHDRSPREVVNNRTAHGGADGWCCCCIGNKVQAGFKGQRACGTPGRLSFGTDSSTH